MAKKKHKKTDLTKEGTISFNVQHEHPDWPTNGNGYDFGTISMLPITVSARKDPNGILNISITGPFNKTFNFHRVIPPTSYPAFVHVALTWGQKTMQLYLNGLLAEEAKAK